MKKYVVIIIIIALFALNVYCKANDLSVPQPTSVEQAFERDYQKELDRANELRRLQDPTIIQKELRDVGKLIVLEGLYHYIDTPDEKLFNITLRQIHINLLYRYGIGIDFNDIEVVRIDNNYVAYLKIPKNKIQLQFIEMIANESSISEGKNFIFASQFKPSETTEMTKQSQQTVANKIGASEVYSDRAIKNIENYLEKFVLMLGYTRVEFV